MSVYVWLGLALVAVVVAADALERGAGYVARRFPSAASGADRLLKRLLKLAVWGICIGGAIAGWLLMPARWTHGVLEGALVFVVIYFGGRAIDSYVDGRDRRHREIIERLDRLERHVESARQQELAAEYRLPDQWG